MGDKVNGLLNTQSERSRTMTIMFELKRTSRSYFFVAAPGI
jgi:hypothetical protein